MKILHITPHVGKGVGAVLLDYLAMAAERPDDHHKVVELEDQVRTAARRAADRQKILVNLETA